MFKKLNLKTIVLLTLLLIFFIFTAQCRSSRNDKEKGNKENNKIKTTEEENQAQPTEEGDLVRETASQQKINEENTDTEEERGNVKKENLLMLKDMNQCPSCDLSDMDLSGLNLESANLSEADLTRVDLKGVNLSYASLEGANVSNANLSKANLSGAGLSGADFTDADLSGADFTGADITNTVFEGVIVDELTNGLDIPVPEKEKTDTPSKTELINSLKDSGECIGCDLSGMELKDEYLMDSNLSGANLSKAILDNALMGGSELLNADLTSASLIKTGLEKANLSGADLSRADLTNAYLTQADLRGADFTDAILVDTDFTEAKIDDATKGIPDTILKTINTSDITEKDIESDAELLKVTNLCVSCDLSNLDLSNLDLSEADISNSTINYTSFNNAILNDANLSDSSLIDANFTDAVLINANLRNTDLSRAIFINADLSGTDFTGAYLKGAVFKDAVVDSNTQGLHNDESTESNHQNKYWVGEYQELTNRNLENVRRITLKKDNTFVFSIGSNKGNKGEIIDKGNGSLILKNQEGMLMSIDVKNDEFTFTQGALKMRFKKVLDEHKDSDLIAPGKINDKVKIDTKKYTHETIDNETDDDPIERLLDDSPEKKQDAMSGQEWIGKYTASSGGIKRIFELKSDNTYDLITIDKRIKPIKLSGTIIDKGNNNLKLKSSGGSVVSITLSDGKFTYITGNTTWEFVKEE